PARHRASVPARTGHRKPHGRAAVLVVRRPRARSARPRLIGKTMNNLHPVDQLIRATLRRAGFRDTSDTVVTEVLADLAREDISPDTFVTMPVPQLYALVHAMKWDRRFATNHDPDSVAIALGQTPWSERRGQMLRLAVAAAVSIGVLWLLLAGKFDDVV